jgi:hypothetical protein
MMSVRNMTNKRFLEVLRFLGVLTVVFVALTATARAQSTDPLNPTVMTSDTVKGRWPSGKRISYYYSFVAGPGLVKVSFNCKPDNVIDGVGGQLLDADGRPFVPLENIQEGSKSPSVEGLVYQQGKLFVGTYEIKRRQKFIFKFYTTNLEGEMGGSYTIKVSGDGVTFADGGDSSSNNPNSSNRPAAEKASCLPKSGKLRLVMDDGTIQEINLTRVKEMSVRP